MASLAEASAAPLSALLKDAKEIQTALNPSADALRLATKVVGNIVKNGAEPKFRRINLAGKAGSKLTAAPQSVALLQALGFVDTGDNHLELPAEVSAEDLSAANASLAEAVAALPAAPRPAAAAPVQTYVPQPTMSLKQKALLMEEEKRKAKQANDKRQRAEELARFNRDKYARENDENWSAQAAGVKGGKDIGTYRDKFGEDGGGG